MKHDARETGSGYWTPHGPEYADTSDSLVDTAISHCEKLRRVLELEGWIREARDQPLLARACRRWQEEREQLTAELELSH
jgi:hypothetical protein